MSRHISCHVTSYVMSCHVICHVKSSRMLCNVTSYVMSRHMSRHVSRHMSRHIIYHISYHIPYHMSYILFPRSVQDYKIHMDMESHIFRNQEVETTQQCTTVIWSVAILFFRRIQII